MVIGPELDFLRQEGDHPFQPVVRELGHPAARGANTMLVHLARRERLVPLEALAEPPRRRATGLLDLGPGLAALLPAHDEHVARGIDAQPVTRVAASAR